MTLTAMDFDTAQVDFVPLSLRDIKLQKSDVAWSDIGGKTLASYDSTQRLTVAQV